MNALQKIKMILTLTCDESSRLLSDDLERRLTRSERIALRMHLLVCRSCRRFRRQTRFLRDLMNRLHRDATATGESLPPLAPAARQRIHAAAHKAHRENS